MATHYSLKPGCSFFPFHSGSGAEEYIVRTADDRQFRISGSARRLLETLDQGVSLEQIYAQMAARQPDLTWEQLRGLIRQHYGPLLVSSDEESPSSSEPQLPRMQIILARTLLKKEAVQKIAARAALLYSPLMALPIVVSIAMAHFWVYTSFSSTPGASGHVFVVLVATLGSIIAHEFGHASAVSRYGGKPGPIGAGFYILLPIFFADVSQVWTFQRRHRAVVDLGGIYFQQITFLAFAAAAVLGHSPSFKATCMGIDVMTLIAINPMFRFDGYWVLVDWLGIPNLHRAAGTYLKRLLSSIRQLKWFSVQDMDLHLGGAKAVAFMIYAFIGHPLLIMLILWNLRWIKSAFLALVWLSPMLFKRTMMALAGHDWITALDLVTALLFLFASSVTLFVAVYLRGRQIAGLISARNRVPAITPTSFEAKSIPQGRNLS
jgi:putative peptide zinc metalloprotease protein